jgi:hypothetical protein
MTVGADIKEAITEVGAGYTILRDSGHISGEFGLLEYSAQVTKPLTIEHFRRGTMSYDTEVVTGDVLEFNKTLERFLVTNKLADLFEDGVVQYDTVLYKCNISDGTLLRPSGETWGDSYHKETQWEVIKNNCDAMQVAALYGNDLETEQELALMGLQKDEVLLQQSIGAQVNDRWQPASGEYYHVTTIESRRYPSIDVLIVEEDRR